MSLFWIVLSIASLAAEKPVKLSWESLRGLRTVSAWSDVLQDNWNQPVFPASVQPFAGKRVFLTGYVVPIHPENGEYVLSANPYTACFFCGKAGPETVCEVYLEKPPRVYLLDELISFSGTFVLNRSDPDHLYYQLVQAREYTTR